MCASVSRKVSNTAYLICRLCDVIQCWQTKSVVHVRTCGMEQYIRNKVITEDDNTGVLDNEGYSAKT